MIAKFDMTFRNILGNNVLLTKWDMIAYKNNLKTSASQFMMAHDLLIRVRFAL